MLRHAICTTMATLVFAAIAPAYAADRAKAAMTCSAYGTQFAYDCTVDVTNARTGAPVDGANVVLGADMPSMPMVHNVPPHPFKATGKPGQYAARIQLDMHGAWAIKLRITGPLRDEVVEVYEFGEKDASPRGKTTAAPPGRAKSGGHRH